MTIRDTGGREDPDALSRRSVVRGGVAFLSLTALASLAGCGLRFEWPPRSGQSRAGGVEDAKATPAGGQGLSTSASPEQVATRALTGMATVVTAARTASAVATKEPFARQLSALHEVQLQVLTARLAALGSPPLGEPGSPKPLPLLQAEAAGLGVSDVALVRALAAAERPHDASLALSLMAQRRYATARLGGPRPSQWPAPTYAAQDAVRLLTAARATEYGLLVTAGRAGAAHRKTADSILAGTAARRAELEELAGAQAPAPPLGYVLPRRVRTAADAAKLGQLTLDRCAQTVLAGLAATLGSGNDITTSDESTPGGPRNATAAHTTTAPATAELTTDIAPVVGLIEWLAELEGAAVSLGRAPSPLPGLQFETSP